MEVNYQALASLPSSYHETDNNVNANKYLKEGKDQKQPKTKRLNTYYGGILKMHRKVHFYTIFGVVITL